jgi:hypothetical protein
MICYHIRYNIYPLNGAPVEKEEWLSFDSKRDEGQVKRFLIDKCGLDVSIILHQVIGEEQYHDRCHDPILPVDNQERIDTSNLNDWRIAIPFNMLRKLNEDADENNIRYRNIDKPPPLL